MGSIKENEKVSFLDSRSKPEWELIDFEGASDHYEYELFESIAAEYTDIAGFPVEFYMADLESDTIDNLYGEDPLKKLIGPFRSKLTYEPTNEQALLDMFGFNVDDTVQYAEMPKVTFERDVIQWWNKNEDLAYDRESRKPIPGDVVKTLWDGQVYELSHVNSAEKIFQGKKLVWSFVLRPFRYGNEDQSVDDMLFADIDSLDYPEVNTTTVPIESDAFLAHNQMHGEEACSNDDLTGSDEFVDDDVDPEFYGYLPNIRRSEEE